ncbi:MAG: hypothetical protein EHM64_10740 [Ignavibacteriae bacterium]|nr:MAG: hypothetical protein EHM64_10740 [Ignavibacteriota bacterium]
MSGSVKIIENGFVYSGDKQNRAGRQTIIIQGGRIVEMGKRAEALKPTYPKAEIIDAAGKLLLPGFVDAHHTGESFILRYLTDGHPMSRWNKNPGITRALEYLRKEATYQEFLSLYRLSYYSALKSGVTTLAEHGFDSPDHSFPASFEAMQQSNQRGFIGLHNGDQFEAARKLHNPAIRFAFVVADEENLTTYNLQSTIRMARNLAWPIMLHLGQSRQAFNIIKKNFTKSVAQLYAEYRAMDSPAHLIHLACFEDGDHDLIAKSRLPLIYSPTAIIRKGGEIPPFEELRRHKMSFAMGSDWGDAKPLENIQHYCSIIKTLGLPIEDAYALLALHTVNGASALGMEDEIGTIEPGKKADVVFLDLSDFRLNPILAEDHADRILEVVLREAASSHVSDVMINGEFYVRGGLVLTYSEEDLAREGQAIFKKLLSFREPKAAVDTPPASIFKLPVQKIKELNSFSDDMNLDEGFRVIRKGSSVPGPETKRSDSHKTEKDPPPNIKKIFGEEESG